MRVLQLIDSLNPGGAERMAVNIANSLYEVGVQSHLCATREEGSLKSKLDKKVKYLFIHRTQTLDFSAFLKLYNYIKKNKITHLHAHGTSFLFATLLKMASPSLTLIWHEHKGERIYTKIINSLPLYFCSFFFSAVITVNQALEKWVRTNLSVNQVFFLSNFVPNFRPEKISADNKKIVCLANLRQPKNHALLLKAFKSVHLKHPEWHLQLLGGCYGDLYHKNLQGIVATEQLEGAVTFAGNNKTVAQELSSSGIGVLSSDNEGLPMALLEYGAAGLPVVCTDVGQCSEVVNNYGKIVPPQNAEALAKALLFYIENEENRIADGLAFSAHISKNYAEAAVIPKLLIIYKEAAQ